MRLSLIAICVCALAQTPPKLAFEVVSIKPAPKGTPNEMLRDGRLHNRGDDAQIDIGAMGLPGLIEWAFDVPADQVKGHVKEAWGNVKDAASQVHNEDAAAARAHGETTGHDIRESVTNAVEHVKDSINRGLDHLKHDHDKTY